jgi:hypothetical protein
MYYSLTTLLGKNTMCVTMCQSIIPDSASGGRGGAKPHLLCRLTGGASVEQSFFALPYLVHLELAMTPVSS